MKSITHPLKQGMQGDAIADLQQSLITLHIVLSTEEIARSFFGQTTHEAISIFQTQHQLEATGEVDEETAMQLNTFLHRHEHEERREEHERERERAHRDHDDDDRDDDNSGRGGDGSDGDDNGHGHGHPPTRYTVQGTVRDANGQGLAALRVQTFEKTLRQEKLLAEGKTQQNGTYTITYHPPIDPKATNAHFNLIVKVLNGQGQVWLTSPIIFNAQAKEQVDLMVGGGTYAGNSTYEALLAAIQPSLDGVPVGQLAETDEHQDITFIANDSNQDAEEVMRLVVSFRLQEMTDLAPEVFFAFLQQGLPTNVPRSLLTASDHFKQIDLLLHNTLSGIVALTASIQQNTLQQALQKNIVPLSLKANIDQIVQKLQTLRVNDVLQQPYLAGKTSLHTMLGLSTLPQTLYTTFAQLYLNHQGTSHEFWQTLAQQQGFTADSIADLRLTLGVGNLVKNHPPLVAFLKHGFQQQTYIRIQDLAKLDLSDWQAIIKQSGNDQVKGYPANMGGKTEDDKINTYAYEIYTRIEHAFPTTSLVAHVDRATTSLVAYKPQVMQFFTNNPTLNLTSIHIDRYLQDQGEQALQNIPTELRPHVIEQVKAMQRVQRLAPSTASAAALLAQKLHSSQQIYFISQPHFITSMVANGATQTEARRVYQRAAQSYALVLAQFTQFNAQFNRATPVAFSSPILTNDQNKQLQNYPTLQTLFGSLDYCSCSECASVLGAAAYLVDILHFLDARKTKTGTSVKDSLLKRRPDLGMVLLNCQNTNTPLPYIDLVCELLENVVAPPSPPAPSYQTTWSAEELLASPQYINNAAYDTLKKAVYPITLPYNLPLEEARVYLEHLGVPRYQLLQTFQNRTANPMVLQDSDIAAEFFGISSDEQNLIVTADTANQTMYWNETNPVTALSNVADFLQKSRLNYSQLLELFNDVAFIQQGGIVSTIESLTDACDTTQQQITNLSLVRLDAIHRFLRLWRKTIWRMWELDSILSSTLGGNILNADTLTLLMHFNQLQQQLSLSVEQFLGFYSNLNTISRDLPDGHIDALYVRLFLNSAVIDTSDTSPTAPATVFSIANVTQASPTALLNDYLPILQAALSAQETDISTLIATTDGKISLTNLSLLYRYVTLARVMLLSISDLLTFLNVAGITDPFKDVATTQRVLDSYTFLQSSGFTLLQITYLLTYAPNLPVAISSDQIVSDINQLNTALQKATGQPQDAIKQTVMSLFQLNSQQANTLLTTLQLPGATVTLLAALGTNMPLQNPPQNITDAEANVPNVCAALRLLDKLALLIRQLAISADDLTWLIGNVAAYGGFDLSQMPIQTSQTAITFTQWQQLMLVMQFKKRYPPSTSDIGSFFAVLAAAQVGPKSAVLNALSTLTKWDSGELIIVDAALNLQLSDYQLMTTYQRLQACFALLHRLAAKAASVTVWAQHEPTPDDADAIKQTAKSKYDNAHWLTIAPPLQDVLRDGKRAALVEYLIAHPELDPRPTKWTDSNDLFDYFLIDVEMTSCQLTSRIVQATNTVQLYVQRCFMNLEDDVVVDSSDTGDPDWLQWQWMKEYRLWEANRQVFLYPENWILPELRTDKSPFFQDLEHDLLQNEITNDNVEAALLTYLQKVNDVAHLEVCGMYEDDETGILHVFARTHGNPPTYYYRKYQDSEWSAWEKVPLNIKSDHLMPVIYNRKLYLFWPIFTEKSESNSNQPQPVAQPSSQPPSPPNSYWEIQLAWSFYRNGKWTDQTLSDLKLIQPEAITVNTTSSTGSGLSFSFSFNTQISLSPPVRPTFAYTFKMMTRGLDLVINVFASLSLEFDTSNYSETASPQQVAEFVFNGNVTAVNIVDQLLSFTSFAYVTLLEWIQTSYSADGRAIGAVSSAQSPLLLPQLAHYNYEGLTNNASGLTITNGVATEPMYVLKTDSLRLDNGELLVTANAPYEVIVPHQDAQFDSTRPFFYQDMQRAYFVEPSILYQWGSRFRPDVPPSIYNATYEVSYLFKEFYHPYVTLFIRELDRLGVSGIYNRNLQINPGSVPPGDSFSFSSTYTPTALVAPDSDQEIVDFSDDGAYAIYNWELFFHAPLMLAIRLTQNQRFEEAMQWFHYIFDPTNPVPDNGPRRFWITKPFYELNDGAWQQSIDNLLKLVNQGNTDLNHQVDIWRKYPFDPNRIARLRNVAYEKTVVMKYLDMLIAWGDNLFTQDTMETVNLATQLYVRAAEILGPRPQEIPALTPVKDLSFNDLEQMNLDAFSNVLTQVENTIILTGDGSAVEDPNTPKLPYLTSFYFCIPANDQLLGYWDTVADRLFKIRHCMNIQGVVQQLPLFAPPINPALLVQAIAAGIDLNSILNDITATLPYYRFHFLLQRAYDFCREVQTLGQKLLTALERQDAEDLALLRSSQEIIVQQALQQIRQQQIDEANQLVDVLKQALKMVQIRQTYYGSRPFMNGGETAAVAISGTATIILLGLSTVLDVLASDLHLIPNFSIGISGFGGTPHVSASIGGTQFGGATADIAKGLQTGAAISEIIARLAATLGQYQRRQDEWNFQKQLADQDLVHVTSQITAATIRSTIATQQAQLQDTIAANVQAVDDRLHSKFTNKDLYSWMVDQISAVYFQAYQLAYAMAKNAEACFQYELGLQTSSYIQFGYWDSLKMGLLAGNKLYYDLHRMESDYLTQNQRLLEVTKFISLAQINPQALETLRTTGTCQFDLSEILFDMDYPGHYMRRIKMVRMTVNAPKIALNTNPLLSPNVNATLTLAKNSVRVRPDLVGGNYTFRKPTDPSDMRFVDSIVPESIVTSNGVGTNSYPGDGGWSLDTEMYKIEVRDDRYYPFEGAGVISSWQLDMPQENNQIDISTITDIVLTLTYTAKNGVDKNAVQGAVNNALAGTGLALTLDVAKGFSDAWNSFLNPGAGKDQVLNLSMIQGIPFALRNRNITIKQIDLITQFEQATNLVADITIPPQAVQEVTLAQDGVFGTLQHVELSNQTIPLSAASQWQIKLRTANATDFQSLPAKQLLDMFIVLYLQVN